MSPSSHPAATFAGRYCALTGCPPEKFFRRIFWRTLHWHALPLAPLLLIGDYFESDRSLIAACGRASHMREIRDETRDFPFHPQNSSWLHRHANLRISTRRLRKLAASLLPAETHGARPSACAPPKGEPARPGRSTPHTSRSPSALDSAWGDSVHPAAPQLQPPLSL